MAEHQPGDKRATEVITFTVAPGRQEDFEAWAHQITAAATRWEGHLGASWLRPEQPGDKFQVVVAFRNEALLEAWMSSEERKSWIGRLEDIATAHEVRQTGLESWFNLPGHRVVPPPRWKMTLVTFSAVYPLSLLYNWLVASHVRHVNLFGRAALFPVLLTPLLTYVVMPRLSNLLRRFLYGRT